MCVCVCVRVRERGYHDSSQDGSGVLGICAWCVFVIEVSSYSYSGVVYVLKCILRETIANWFITCELTYVKLKGVVDRWLI